MRRAPLLSADSHEGMPARSRAVGQTQCAGVDLARAASATRLHVLDDRSVAGSEGACSTPDLSSSAHVLAALVKPLRYGVQQVDSSLQTLGRFLDLAAQSLMYLVMDAVRLRHPWRDAVNQAWFIVSVTTVPALLVSVPFGVIVAVQVGSVIQQVGATSISGAAGGLGVIRQGAPIVAALLLGGAAGSAVTTDLGARTIREEVDALRVMGVDPVRRLVTPRLAAILFVAPVLCFFIIFMGLAAGYLINVGFQSGTPGSYIASFASFASVTDVVVALLKTWLFGVVVILVACQRGLEAKGGARGVADAVNAAVVIGVVTVFIFNVVITQIVTMFMPTRMG